MLNRYELNPDQRGIPRELPTTREALVNRTYEVLIEYGDMAVTVLHDMVRKGEGRHVLGSVPGRPEDEQLQIDTAGENILVNLARDNNLPSFIMGEHNHYRPINIPESGPYVVLPIDSFDNSKEYKLGLDDTTAYTVVGAYHPDGEPIGAVVGNIFLKRLYFSLGNETFVRDLESGETKRIIPRLEKPDARQANCVVATYLGSNVYSVPFVERFLGLIKDMHPKGKLHEGGGAYIYALLATGAVDAYVMLGEPRTEIDPGLPLALATGCTVVSVNPDGSFENYRFDPNHHDDHVPFFIASRTPALRDNIIQHYLQSQP